MSESEYAYCDITFANHMSGDCADVISYLDGEQIDSVGIPHRLKRVYGKTHKIKEFVEELQQINLMTMLVGNIMPLEQIFTANLENDMNFYFCAECVKNVHLYAKAWKYADYWKFMRSQTRLNSALKLYCAGDCARVIITNK